MTATFDPHATQHRRPQAHHSPAYGTTFPGTPTQAWGQPWQEGPAPTGQGRGGRRWLVVLLIVMTLAAGTFCTLYVTTMTGEDSARAALAQAEAQLSQARNDRKKADNARKAAEDERDEAADRPRPRRRPRRRCRRVGRRRRTCSPR